MEETFSFENVDIVAIIESMEAVQHTLRRFDGRRLLFVTTNPYVLECCAKQGIRAAALDGPTKQSDADRVGYATVDATLFARERLDARLTEIADAPLLWALVLGLQRALTFYLYNAMLLAPLLDQARAEGVEIVAVGSVSDTPVQGFRVVPDRFDTLFAVLASRLDIPVEPFVAQRPSGAMETGDFLRPSFWTRCVTLMNAPLTSLAFRLFKRLYGGRTIRLRPAVGGRNTLILNQSNELVEELFLAELCRRRIVFKDFRRRPRGSDSNGAGCPDLQFLRPELERAFLDGWREQGLAVTDPVLAAVGIVAERTVEALKHGVARVREITSDVDRTVGRLGRNVTIVNANNSPEERLLRHICRQRNIACVNLEHGIAPGLSPLHKAISKMDNESGVREFLFYTPAQKELASAHIPEAEREGPWSAVVGVPSLVRSIKVKWLQRTLQRMALRTRGRVICWCTGLYPNNFQFLPHYWRDSHYHRLRKAVVHEVLSGIDGQMLFKLYPTYRYTDPDPFSDMEDLPANFRIEQFTDFRNMRAAVDVLIVDGPGSILSWAWSARVPLIYLETGMYVLSDPFRAALEKAAFVVDCREPDWIAEMKALLTMDHKELQAEYHRRRSAASSVEAHYIFGPADHRRRRFNEFIARRDLPRVPGAQSAFGTGATGE